MRQLFYQFVSRLWIANKQTHYGALSRHIANARLAGLIDWDSIEDRTRALRVGAHWDDPQVLIGAAAAQYREDYWANQKYRPEVWIEKDPLVGVIKETCRTRYRVPYFSCRGRVSLSELYAAGKRFA